MGQKSKENVKVFPMAYKPMGNLKTKIYYVGFPENWKKELIEIEKEVKGSKWTEKANLPTYALKKSIEATLDNVATVGVLNQYSDDKKWLISCDTVDLGVLTEYIKIWLWSYYINNSKISENIKDKIENFMNKINKKDLEGLCGEEEVLLFDEQGKVIENYTYTLFCLLIINKLIGKHININGKKIKLNYAGKNELISDIQEENLANFSYGIKFSLQTLPSAEEPLLLCECVRHRYILGNGEKINELGEKIQKSVFLKNDVTAHIWLENDRIYKILMEYINYNRKCIWKTLEQKHYNIVSSVPLPDAEELINNIEKYLHGTDRKISCSYKNGMYKNGFKENKSGVGVSIKEKAKIYKDIKEHLEGVVTPLEQLEKVGRTSGTTKNLETDELKFNKEFSFEEQLFLRKRLKTCLDNDNCTEKKGFKVEVYYKNDDLECAEKIFDKLKNIFGEDKELNKELNVILEMKPLNKLGDPLDVKKCDENGKRLKYIDKTEGIYKRIQEIKTQINLDENYITGAIILLPDADEFDEDDPKVAIRTGFSLREILTQFIVPWNDEIENLRKKDKKDNNEEEKQKIYSAIADLLRSFGYLRELEVEKLKKNSLSKTTIGTIYLYTQVNGFYKKARFVPVYLETNFINGTVTVDCPVLSKRNLSYRQVAFEFTKISMNPKFEKISIDRTRGFLKQKLEELKRKHSEKEPLLILIEADGNTRGLWKGITNQSIYNYELEEKYIPKEINVSTKIDSNEENIKDNITLIGTGIRIVRIRKNSEVPDYFTVEKEDKKGKYVNASGIFKYKGTYWDIVSRPKNKDYMRSYEETSLSHITHDFKQRNIVEFFPLQLQKGDNADKWIKFANSLRNDFIQYNDTAILPLPLHLAKKLESYFVKK